jgi:hypothetical protein
MWPFKKKETISVYPLVRSRLCIPGFLEDSIEIFGKTDGQFMVVGNVMMYVLNKHHYSFELGNRDEKMNRWFSVAGKITSISSEYLDLIEKHTSVIYISCETGSLYNAWFLATAGAALLGAGGIGIKVVSTGKAFAKEKWIELTGIGTAASMYKLFVVDSILKEDGATFSCGMHNIGLRDAIVSGLKFEEAQKLIRIFNFYQLIDKPIIKPKQSFQTEVSGPFFSINDEPDQPYLNDKLLKNPFGMWRLVRQ